MSDPYDITVRAQALDGQWETLGADRYRGVVPEGVNFSFNEWGPDVCGFTLHRDPDAIHPDMTTWTPIEVEVAGVVVWDGRVKETPVVDGDDPNISVQAEGWQYHLDDDVYSALYIKTSLDDCVDVRSLPLADLTQHKAYGVVSVGSTVTLEAPKGVVVTGSEQVAATVDLGVNCTTQRIVFTVDSSNNSASWQFYVIAHNTPYWSSDPARTFPGTTSSGIVNNTFSATNVVGTVNPVARYLTFMLNTSTPHTTTADIWFRVNTAFIFGKTAYESSNASILKADVVIKDAISLVAPLLSTDTSQINGGTFSIPEYAPVGAHSPREVITAVNAYENYETKILVGRRLYFKPRATAPIYEIGEWSGAEFQDASANSGDEIYNRVLVEGTGPDGAKLGVERWSSSVRQPLTPLANPSATVNALNWTATTGGGTIARDTGVFHSSPGAFALGGGTFPWQIDSDAVTQTMTKGRRYYLTAWFANNTIAPPITLSVLVNGTVTASTSVPFVAAGAFQLFELGWTQPVTGTNYSIRFSQGVSPSGVRWDDVAVSLVNTTLIDRRQFTRTKILPVSASLTLASAA